MRIPIGCPMGLRMGSIKYQIKPPMRNTVNTIRCLHIDCHGITWDILVAMGSHGIFSVGYPMGYRGTSHGDAMGPLMGGQVIR